MNKEEELIDRLIDLAFAEDIGVFAKIRKAIK